jgi:signal-transduction protein with cAMP-binding, CBS, and nucleotidyltransferase domain
MDLVSEIMTEKVLYVNASQPIEECMALMTQKRIRHLPKHTKKHPGMKMPGVFFVAW